MKRDPYEHPRIRPLEPLLIEHNGQRLIGLRDPSGVSEYSISVSPTTYFVVTLFDGERSMTDIQKEFSRQSGRLLPLDKLEELVGKLDQTLFLDSPRFEEHYREQVEAYRAATARPSREAWTFGCGDLSLDEYLENILANRPGGDGLNLDGSRLLGVVAPHLDYPRGWPCYGQAYDMVRRHCDASRFVILGTNHFGLSQGAVSTTKDFGTPFGAVSTDRDFVERLSDGCGVDLCENEYDHLREHSVELQVVWLRHVLADRELSIVPLLCPDPCGPTGTAPSDGNGVDLRELGKALGKLIDEDPVGTCVIAGADLSHVGANFGDARHLSADFLADVEQIDRAALEALTQGGPSNFVEAVRRKENPTRICSAGCLFVLAETFPEARAHVLGYHQAVDQNTQTCVTCVAAAFVEPETG